MFNVKTAPLWKNATTFNGEIDTVVFDVDGTLLNDQHQLLPSTISAVQRLIDSGIFVMLATGKSYASTRAVRRALGIRTVGIYVQGLVVCDAMGAVMEQRLLDRAIVDDALAIADHHQLGLVAYSGKRLVTPSDSAKVAVIKAYHEPLPHAVPQLAGVLANKLLLIGAQHQLDAIRPNLVARWSHDARLVQAVPNMLEVVPYGSSKGATVARILKRLGRSASQTLAFGDGENDLELLRWAGASVAMGNASEHVQNSADFVTLGNNQDAIAYALRHIKFSQPLFSIGHNHDSTHFTRTVQI